MRSFSETERRTVSHVETWPSGRRHFPAKEAYGLKPVSRVRIPPSPPVTKSLIRQGFFYFWCLFYIRWTPFGIVQHRYSLEHYWSMLQISRYFTIHLNVDGLLFASQFTLLASSAAPNEECRVVIEDDTRKGYRSQGKFCSEFPHAGRNGRSKTKYKISYGLIMGWLVSRHPGVNVCSVSVLFGLAIYPINFYLIAPVVFPWFVQAQNWQPSQVTLSMVPPGALAMLRYAHINHRSSVGTKGASSKLRMCCSRSCLSMVT
jgi:hypothetical protein